MQTITLPRDLYFSRIDDESNEYFGYLTVLSAAEAWAEGHPDRNFHSVNVDDPHDGPVVFAWREDERTTILVAEPNGVEDCYPGDALPFKVAPSRFAVGDWINTRADLPDPRRVTAVEALTGRVRIDVNGAPGLLEPRDLPLWNVVEAPKLSHTFTVTVSECTAEQAERVMSERIGPDEDYGFNYRIGWVSA